MFYIIKDLPLGVIYKLFTDFLKNIR